MKTKLTKSAKRFAWFGLQAIMLVFLPQSLAYATGGTPSGSGTEGDPFLIADYEDLKVVGTDSLTYSLNGVYRLTADIDASPSATEHGDSGFVPIGKYPSAPFTGVFHGGGHVINSLTINRDTVNHVGLFGFLDFNATIDSLGLLGCSIKGQNDVGSLVGWNDGGNIMVCYTNGSVTGYRTVGGLVGYNGEYGDIIKSCAEGSVTCIFDNAGGLVGFNSNGTVSESYSISTVTGKWQVGGLVGTTLNTSSGSVNGCYATGSVTGSFRVGGLVGYSWYGAVAGSYATGSVMGDSCSVGGLMGENVWSSSINKCFATGNVTGPYQVGGLAGYNRSSSVIACYATGSIYGDTAIGGLVGTNSSDGNVNNSYASGQVVGMTRVGGLIGMNRFGILSKSYSTGAVLGTGNYIGGLLGYNETSDTLNDCYWNTETSGLIVGVGVDSGVSFITGLTTAPMKQTTSFSSWSFNTTWTILSDSTYPGLQGLDNAPFAFYDTLISNRIFVLSRLLLNDCDVETKRNNLVLHVTNVSVGTTDSITALTFDTGIANGTVDTIKYRVGEVRASDTLWGNIAKAYITLDTTYMGVDNAETTVEPMRFGLNQNYPNPFKSKTAISYQLLSAGHVNLKVYDMLGRQVATLVNGLKPAGLHSSDFNAVELAGGVYFYRLQAGTLTETKKLILLK
jgi:hypothetical protein